MKFEKDHPVILPSGRAPEVPMFRFRHARSGVAQISRAALTAFAALTAAAASHAGYVTTNEDRVDAIYAQPGFGATPIDVVFAAVQTLIRDDLRVIDTSDKLNALFDLAPAGLPSINVFFVDQLRVCGSAFGDLGGCAETPGNLLVVESEFTANATYGANNLAHEIAHNLGLSHVLPDDGTNLLNPTISTSFALTQVQINTLLSSALVQTNANGGRYITVTPIAVVPEPQALALLLAGVGMVSLGMRRRRRE